MTGQKQRIVRKGRETGLNPAATIRPLSTLTLINGRGVIGE